MIKLIKKELNGHIVTKLILATIIVIMGLVATAESNLFDGIMTLFFPAIMLFATYLVMIYRGVQKEDFVLRNLPVKTGDIVKSLYISQLIYILMNLIVFLAAVFLMSYLGKYEVDINIESILAGVGLALVIAGTLMSFNYIFKDKANIVYTGVYIAAMMIVPKGRYIVNYIREVNFIVFVVGIAIFIVSYMISDLFLKKYE